MLLKTVLTVILLFRAVQATSHQARRRHSTICRLVCQSSHQCFAPETGVDQIE